MTARQDASRYVCVVGGANVDIEGRVAGRLEMADSNPGTVKRSAGGVGRNIAENLVRLDVSTRFITAFGRDHQGTWLHDETTRAGVDLTDSIWSDDTPTSTYLSVIDGSGEMIVAVNDMEVLAALDGAALGARRQAIAGAAAVVVDCNLKSESLGPVVNELADGPVFVDPVSSAKAERIAPHLGSVHTIKPNRAEAQLLSGVEISGERSLRTAASALLDTGLRQVVISLGVDGLFFADAEASGTIARPDLPVASVTGAGDALMAGLVHAHLANLPIESAARFALAAAAITASSTQPVAPDLSTKRIHDLLEKAAS
ncbi:MAG: PfkB family carbohydrate kinase [Acidimicrobiia bacterium]|nr:PfkB family carbohydrate kinase [Acidimicrobiia bacterium]